MRTAAYSRRSESLCRHLAAVGLAMLCVVVMTATAGAELPPLPDDPAATGATFGNYDGKLWFVGSRSSGGTIHLMLSRQSSAGPQFWNGTVYLDGWRVAFNHPSDDIRGVRPGKHEILVQEPGCVTTKVWAIVANFETTMVALEVRSAVTVAAPSAAAETSGAAAEGGPPPVVGASVSEQRASAASVAVDAPDRVFSPPPPAPPPPASSPVQWHPVSYQLDLGTGVPTGAIADAITWRLDIRPTFSVAIKQAVYLDIAVDAALLGVAHAGELGTTTCVNSGGGDSCSGDKERAIWIAFPLGISRPFVVGHDTEARLGAGAIYGFYKGRLIEPSGFRHAVGGYARASVQFMERFGVELWFEQTHSEGDRLGSRVAASSSWDTWLGASAFFRVGIGG